MLGPNSTDSLKQSVLSRQATNLSIFCSVGLVHAIAVTTRVPWWTVGMGSHEMSPILVCAPAKPSATGGEGERPWNTE